MGQSGNTARDTQTARDASNSSRTQCATIQVSTQTAGYAETMAWIRKAAIRVRTLVRVSAGSVKQAVTQPVAKYAAIQVQFSARVSATKCCTLSCTADRLLQKHWGFADNFYIRLRTDMLCCSCHKNITPKISPICSSALVYQSKSAAIITQIPLCKSNSYTNSAATTENCAPHQQNNRLQ